MKTTILVLLRAVALLASSSPMAVTGRSLQQDVVTKPPVTTTPDNPTTDVQKDLDDAMALWNSHRSSSSFESYELQFRRDCYCTEEYRASYISTVNNNGVIVAVRPVEGDGSLEADQPLFQDALSVEKLFESIQTAWNGGAFSIQVEYDEIYGYPKSVYIDYDLMLVDEEDAFVVEHFEIIELDDTDATKPPLDDTTASVGRGNEEDGSTGVAAEAPLTTSPATSPFIQGGLMFLSFTVILGAIFFL